MNVSSRGNGTPAVDGTTVDSRDGAAWLISFVRSLLE